MSTCPAESYARFLCQWRLDVERCAASRSHDLGLRTTDGEQGMEKKRCWPSLQLALRLRTLGRCSHHQDCENLVSGSSQICLFRHYVDQVARMRVEGDHVSRVIPRVRLPVRMRSGSFVAFQTSGCRGSRNEVNVIEHVQLFADIEHQKRGSLELYLKSPSGTIPPNLLTLTHAVNPFQELFQCSCLVDRMMSRAQVSRTGTSQVCTFGANDRTDDGV